MELALTAFFLAQAADIVTTVRALERGARESNPVIAWMMAHLGRGWAAVKLAAGGLVAWAMASAGAVPVVWGLAAAFAVIAIRNHRITR